MEILPNFSVVLGIDGDDYIADGCPNIEDVQKTALTISKNKSVKNNSKLMFIFSTLKGIGWNNSKKNGRGAPVFFVNYLPCLRL